MLINTEQIVTMTEANQNFSKTARLAEKNGSAVIFKNNRPKFALVDLTRGGYLELTDEEKMEIAEKRILQRYLPAFKELAK
ncbi:MAG: type II toxin-antitoxin system Phd/YefM family antitoxin [Clostridiales bacterium]|jgi:antitoxin Phd|nr:type II toxin-antitoxin system Phd/YefM family antitoxin [Clostridiales bacterium]